MKRRHLLAAAVALLAASLGLALDARAFWACWLAAWWWTLGLALGAIGSRAIHRLTGGQWGVALGPSQRALARCVPFILLLGLPLLAGLNALYPALFDRAIGAGAHAAWRHLWWQPAFFGGRLIVYAALWCWASRTPPPSGRAGRAAATLLLLLFTGTLASVDLVVSLVPGWTSSAFGILTLTAQMQGGAALAVALAAEPVAHTTQAAHAAAVPVTRDLGNLLLMWTLLWAYLEYMQWLIIWSGNLPREIVWYLPRIRGGWLAMGLAMVALQGVVPVALLLFRRIKDVAPRLKLTATLLLIGSAIGSAWRIVPSAAPHSVHTLWLLPLLFGAFALLVAGRAAQEVRHGQV